MRRVTGKPLDALPNTWAKSGDLRFVEHFSPYCGHCRDFASTWDTLVEDYEDTPINFAQVDCVVNGGKSNPVSVFGPWSEKHTDLCTENGVTGYPHMNLYHDGVFKVQFKGARVYERLIDFLETHTGVSGPSFNEPPPELPEQELQMPSVDRNPHGEVLALTPDSFPYVITDGDVFVKFFAPW